MFSIILNNKYNYLKQYLLCTLPQPAPNPTATAPASRRRAGPRPWLSVCASLQTVPYGFMAFTFVLPRWG